MTKFLVLVLEKDGKWTLNFDHGRRVTAERFDSYLDGEKFAKEKYENVWIDHQIKAYTGHLMTLEDWKESCECGGFVDSDGDGFALDENFEYADSFWIYPSMRNSLGDDVKYILWFNK